MSRSVTSSIDMEEDKANRSTMKRTIFCQNLDVNSTIGLDDNYLINLYKNIFRLFEISAIFSTPDTVPVDCRKQLLFNFFNFIIIVLQTLTSLSISGNRKNKSMIISGLVSSAMVIVLRLVLNKRVKQMKNIVKFVGKYKIPVSDRNAWITWLIIICISTQCFFRICKVFIKNNSYEMQRTFFGFKFNEEYCNVIFMVSYKLLILIFFYLPMNTFCIFYMTVCQHLRAIIKFFTQQLSSGENCNFDKLLHDYTAIKVKIAYIDEKLCFPVLITTINNSSVMYFSIFLALHLEKVGYLDFIPVLCVFLSMFVVFIAMMSAAALVAEAASDVAAKSWLLRDARGSTFSQHKFLLYAEKDTSLTVWKIVPIRRNVIVGFVGAIFTYNILFHSLETSA